MTNYIRNDSKALRACLLYEFKRQHFYSTGISSSYEEFCRVMGDDVIEYEEFEFWFTRFDNEQFDLDYERSPTPTLAPSLPDENLKNDEKFVRSCILYEVLDGKEMDEIYRNLERKLGKSFIAWPEFDFWYYRFKDGSRDIDFDRNSVPRPMTFSDMPVDVVKEIVTRLEYKEQLICRKVSHSLRDVIDDVPPNCESVQVVCKKERIFLKFDEENLLYSRNKRTSHSILEYGTGKIRMIVAGNFIERAFEDLKFLLRNRKLELKNFDVRCGPSKSFNWISMCDRELVQIVANNLMLICNDLPLASLQIRNFSMKIQLDVSLNDYEDYDGDYADYGDDYEHYDGSDEFSKFFEILKPKTLQNISLDICEASLRNIEKLVNTEQWRQAKELHLHQKSNVSIKDLMHFDSFEISVERITVDELRDVRDALSKSPDFKMCRITVSLDAPLDHTLIESALQLKTFPDATNPHLRQYPIPDSNDVLEYDILFWYITIQRKIRFEI